MARVVIVSGPTSSDWKEADIDHKKLEVLQKIVGGYIEVVPIGKGVSIVCNEEGKIHGLPTYAAWVHEGRVHDLIVGTFIVFSTSMRPLTDNALAAAKRYLLPVNGGWEGNVPSLG